MKPFIYLLLCLLIPAQLWADGGIKGTVKGHDNGKQTPLPGVNIHWMGTTSGTVTNSAGEFTIQPSPQSTKLIVSFVGYKNDTIAVTDNQPVHIVLSSDIELQEVVVAQKNKGMYTSKLTPFQTININSAELCKAACCNLAESFVTNPSVDVSYPDAVTGARQIQVLGLAGVYTQLQTENIPNLRGIATGYGLSFVPGPWMESIQVSKGAASVVNGYESITGQVNVEYRKPTDPEKLFLNAYAADDEKYEINAFASGNLGEKWSTAGFVHGRYLNTPIDHNEDGFMDEPLVKQINLMNRWDRKGENGSITRIGVQYMSEERTGGQTTEAHNMSSMINTPYVVGINNDRLNAFVKKGHVFANAKQTSVALIANVSAHRIRSDYGINRYNGDEVNLYTNLMYSSNLSTTDRHHVSAGFNYSAIGMDEVLNANTMNTQQHIAGVYGEYTFKPTEKFTAMTGIRGDYHNHFGEFITPRVHLRYSPTELWVMRASAGKGYRHPSVWAENSNLLLSGRTLNVIENRILENAWNYGFSTSYNWHIGSRELEINAEYFRTNFINQVIADMESSATQIIVGELDGKSFANSYQLDIRIETLPRLDLTAAIRFNDVKQTIGGKLVEKPLNSKYKGLVTLNYTDRLKKWMFDYNVQFIGGGRIPQVPVVATPYVVASTYGAYTLMNAQATRFFRKGSIYVGCENLTDFTQKNPVVAANDPFGQNFDATRVWGPIMGRMFYMGVRFALNKE